MTAIVILLVCFSLIVIPTLNVLAYDPGILLDPYLDCLLRVYIGSYPRYILRLLSGYHNFSYDIVLKRVYYMFLLSYSCLCSVCMIYTHDHTEDLHYNVVGH